MKTLLRSINWRAVRISLLAYVLFDVFIGGVNGGFFPLTPAAGAQTAPSIVFLGQKQNLQHAVGGIFYAPAYATWNATELNTIASGSQTITVTCNSGGVVGVCQLSDGYSVPLTSIFNTNTPITLLDANTETVTPSAVGSPAPCGAAFLGVGAATQCINVTATFSNAHGASAVIVSGDAGIEEAITDAGASGGGLVYWIADTGIVTLNTGALTTTTSTKIPTNRSSTGAAAKVTTTITTSANWGVGSAASGVSFCSANSTLTAGTTCVANQVAPTSTGTTSALEAVVFTMGTSNPGAGAIKARVWGFTPVQPTN